MILSFNEMHWFYYELQSIVVPANKTLPVCFSRRASVLCEHSSSIVVPYFTAILRKMGSTKTICPILLLDTLWMRQDLEDMDKLEVSWLMGNLDWRMKPAADTIAAFIPQSWTKNWASDQNLRGVLPSYRRHHLLSPKTSNTSLNAVFIMWMCRSTIRTCHKIVIMLLVNPCYLLLVTRYSL
jgi:hypothetical protein